MFVSNSAARRATGFALAVTLASCATSIPTADPARVAGVASVAGIAGAATAQTQTETWEKDRIQAEKTGITFEFTFGPREFEDEAAWSPLASQREVGIAFQTPLLGVRSEERRDLADYFDWDFGVRYAYGDGRVVPAGGTESLSLGARTWDVSGGLLFVPISPRAMLQPYLGGGLAILFTDVDVVVGTALQRQSDTFAAGYVRGGLRIQIRRGQYFGVDARWLSGSADVEGVGASADATTISFLFGAQF